MAKKALSPKEQKERHLHRLETAFSRYGTRHQMNYSPYYAEIVYGTLRRGVFAGLAGKQNAKNTDEEIDAAVKSECAAIRRRAAK